MADLDFVVNAATADQYAFVGTFELSRFGAQLHPGWEQIGSLRGMLRKDGKVEAIK
jgi:hypothetical protein